MEETPRTDKIVTDWLGGKISAAEMRRQFQNMERDLIRAQVKFVERVNDDKKYLVDPICCLEMGLEDCQAGGNNPRCRCLGVSFLGSVFTISTETLRRPGGKNVVCRRPRRRQVSLRSARLSRLPNTSAKAARLRRLDYHRPNC